MTNSRLVWYLETNSIITPHQSGFRKSRSTIDQIIRLESAVREAFIKREHFVSLILDLEKAYDTSWIWFYWMCYDHFYAHSLLAKLGRWHNLGDMVVCNIYTKQSEAEYLYVLPFCRVVFRCIMVELTQLERDFWMNWEPPQIPLMPRGTMLIVDFNNQIW